MYTCDQSCPLKEGQNSCCCFCPSKDTCQEACGDTPDKCGRSVELTEEQALKLFQKQTAAALKAIAKIARDKKALEAKEKELKDALKEAMERNGIKFFDSPVVKVSYIAATVASSIDSAKLKKLHPEIAAECTKESQRSAYVKIEVKEDETK